MFFNQNRNLYNQHIFAKEKFFFFSCSIKIHVLGFSKLWKSIFCILLVAEAFFLQKVVKMHEEVVVGWQEVKWIWQMRQKFIAQFVQLLKCWLCNVQSGIVVEKNQALSADQCQLQALQFSVDLIDLLSILLRCNSFAKIQKAVVDQISSRPPRPATDHQWPWPSFDASLALGKYFGASSCFNHWAGCH